MKAHIRIWCLRHPESVNVIAGQAGSLPAAELTERGRDQANAVALQLSSHAISWIYTSTAVRAVQAGEIISNKLGVGVTALPELLEVDLGNSEGTTDRSTISQTAEVLRCWIEGVDLSERVDDGENGYSVVRRIEDAFERIERERRGSTVVVIGHVASLTAGLSKMCDLGMRVWGLPLPHAVPFLVEKRGGRWRCDAWPRAEVPTSWHRQ